MTVETATYLSGLVAANPAHTDPLSEADSHFRLLKTVLLATFPNLTGAVTVTQTQLNALANAVLTTGGQTIAGTTAFNAATVSTTFQVAGATTLTGALTGSTAAFSGGLTATTGGFSGALTGASVAASGVVNGATIQQGGNQLLPTGCVIIWSGSAASIPAGWTLCDGTAGTPDLRSKFILGASASGGFAVGATGGATTVTISTANMPSHNHPLTDPGHATALTDPGHSHPLTDPGHATSTNAVTSPTATPGSGIAGGGSGWAFPAATNGAASTGITIGSATTGITAATATTGITVGNNGSGTPVTILPPYMALCFIMKL